jgi:hypothetical protein
MKCSMRGHPAPGQLTGEGEDVEHGLSGPDHNFHSKFQRETWKFPNERNFVVALRVQTTQGFKMTMNLYLQISDAEAVNFLALPLPP